MTSASRIVSLAPSVTEIVFALGAGDRLVGISTYCDYPKETAGIDRVGTFLLPNVEMILAKRPDVVIGVPSPGNRQAVEALQDLGLRVIVVNPDGIASILAAVRAIADGIGLHAAGNDLIARIEQQTAAISTRVGTAAPRRVLMVVDRKPLIAVGGHTYQDELIRLARGINVGAKAGDQWPHLALDFVISEEPDVIIDTTMGNEGRAEMRRFWRTFATIPAVRDGRLYGHGAFVLLRPGPRIAEALETLARFIHPERFE